MIFKRILILIYVVLCSIKGSDFRLVHVIAPCLYQGNFDYVEDSLSADGRPDADKFQLAEDGTALKLLLRRNRKKFVIIAYVTGDDWGNFEKANRPELEEMTAGIPEVMVITANATGCSASTLACDGVAVGRTVFPSYAFRVNGQNVGRVDGDHVDKLPDEIKRLAPPASSGEAAGLEGGAPAESRNVEIN